MGSHPEGWRPEEWLELFEGHWVMMPWWGEQRWGTVKYSKKRAERPPLWQEEIGQQRDELT